MDSTLVRCHEAERYQQRLATLLAQVGRRSAEPTLVTTDLLYLAEDLVHGYLAANRPYCSKKFSFEARVKTSE